MNSPHGDDRPQGQRHDRVKAWRLSSGDDLEVALRAAERLLQQAEERHRHEQNRGFALLSLLVAVGLSLVASLLIVVQVIQFRSSSAEVPVATGGVMVAAAGLLLLLRTLLNQRSRIRHDYTLRLATRLASMISESLVDVADRERWSYLRLQATKLRLSAFPMFDPSKEYYER